MDSIQKIFDTVISNEITLFFAVLIIFVLVLSLLSRLPFFVRFLPTLNRSGATILTTLGVLGTFVGIFLGLVAFDVRDIDASVPELLNGLKIAFSTSILGMGAAVVLKIFQVLVPTSATESADVTPETIHSALTSINDSIERAAHEQHASLEEVRKAISADSDGSLLTQMQKLRTTVQDGQQEFINEFRDFARTMAENNSRALIEALEYVIRDFNTQLDRFTFIWERLMVPNRFARQGAVRELRCGASGKCRNGEARLAKLSGGRFPGLSGGPIWSTGRP